ncbi:MAG: autotransporter-associated beta strand repeat-containing protein [Pirellulales bacterium]|nr:autotransporter-associated beta strand repeat-containing protein [Pirellulales bacterium]
MRSRFLLCLLTGLAMIVPQTAFADNWWVCPTATGKYETAANWYQNLSPTSTDLVFVYKGSSAVPANHTCIIDADTQAFYGGPAPALRLFSGWGTDGTSTINVSADVTVMDLYTAGYHQSTGTINQTAGTVNVYTSQLGWLGGFWLGDSYNGNNNAAGAGVYNLSGGALIINNQSTFAVGGYNAGTFNQTGGSVTTHNVDMGWYPSPTSNPAATQGTYNISAGSLTVANHIDLSWQGWATFTLSGTGSVTTQDMFLGWAGSTYAATSILNVQGGTLDVSNKLTLAAHALDTATVNQSGGTVTVLQMDRGPGTSIYSLTGGTLVLGDAYSHAVGTFQITGGSVTAGSTGTITAGTFDIQGGTAGAILAGSGNLAKSGLGTATLSAVNTYTGQTAITGGTLALAAGSSIAGTPMIHVQSPGQLDVSALSGGLTLAGTQTLKGSGTVAGNVLTSAGSILAPGDSIGTLTLNNNLNLAGSDFLQYELSSNPAGANDKLAIGGNLVLGGLTTISLTAPSGLGSGSYRLIDYAGTLTGSAANFTLQGLPSGTTRQSFNISTATNHQVNLVVAGNPVSLTWKGGLNGNAWDLATTANWNNNTEKFYNFDNVTFDDTGSNSPNINVAGALQPTTVTFNNSAKNYTLGGTGGVSVSGDFTKNGTGKVTIANTGANVFGGNIALNAGTLAFSRADSVNLTGAIAGAGALRQEGAGSLVLAGHNAAFTGSVTVAAGTLQAGNAAAFGTASGIIVNGGTLDINGYSLAAQSVTVGGAGAGGAGAVVNSGGVQMNALKNVAVTSDVTFGGTARWDINAGSLTAAADYKLTKAGTNAVYVSNTTTDSHLADIDIQQGTLWFLGTSTMGNPAKTATVASGASLGFWWLNAPMDKTLVSNGGMIQTAGNITLSGPITLNNDTEFYGWYAPLDSLTLTNSIGGAGGLIKTGTGPLTLTGSNTYAGMTQIRNGRVILNSAAGTAIAGNVTLSCDVAGSYSRLQLQRDSQIAATSVVTFNGDSGANKYMYLELFGHNQTLTGIDDATGTGIIQNSQTETVNGAGILTINVPGTDSHAFNGYLRDNYYGTPGNVLALVKAGTGTLMLSGANVGGYTGGLTVQAGTLDYSSGTMPGGNYTITGGSLNIGTNFSTSTKFTITGGTLDGAGSVASSVAFDVQGGTMNAGLAGSFGVIKTGPDTATLTYPYNSYTGSTIITAGTLALSGSGSIASSPLIQVASGAIFNVAGLYTPFTPSMNQTLQGFGTVQGNVALGADGALGAGSATAGGTLTLNNGLTVSASAAQVDLHLSNSALGANNDRVAVTGAVNFATGSDKANLAIHGFGASLDTANPYTLLTYGSLSGGTTANIALVNNTRYTMSLNFATPGQVKLAVSGAAPLSLKWAGDFTNYLWDTKTTTAWKDSLNVAQKFYEMDAVTFDNSATNTAVTINGAVYPSSITVNNDASHPYSFTISTNGKISGATGLTKTGVGTLAINMDNDFSGAVSITNGTLQIGAPSALGSIDGGVSVSSAGTLDVNGQELVLGKAITIAGAGFGGQGALINTGGTTTASNVKNLVLADNATIGGSTNWSVGGNAAGMAGNGKTLTKVGTNAIALADCGATNLGDIIVNGGILGFVGNSTLGDPAKTATLAENAALGFKDATTSPTLSKAIHVVASTAGSQIAVSNSTLMLDKNILLDGNLTVVNDPASYSSITLSGNISGAGGLIQTGSGVLTLRGANTYADVTVLTNSSGNGTFSEIELDSPSGYAIPGNVLFDSQGSNSITNLWLGLLRGEENGGQPQINPAAVVTFSTLTEGSNLTLYRVLAMKGHTLTIAGAVAESTNSAMVNRLVNGGAAGSTGKLIFNTPSGATHLYRGQIMDDGGSLSIEKTGPGTQIIQGGGLTYSGGTVVRAGTLEFRPNILGTVLPTSNYTITGGTLQLNELSQTIATFQITGGLVDGTGTLTSNAAYDIQGGQVNVVLAGTGIGLNKTGPGTAILANTNTLTGLTTVSNGVLQLGTGGTTGGVYGNILINGSAASLVLNRSDDVTFPLFISGTTGTLTKMAVNKLTLTGVNSFSGLVDIEQGRLALASGGQLGSTVSILNKGVFSIEDSAAHTVGIITGTGTTYVNGTAQLNAVSITQGTLTIGGNHAAAVPEPAALLLLVAGLVAAACRKWIR